MFEKERDIPYKVKAEAALIRRIITPHHKLPQIEEDYRKRLAGVRGEKELDYQLSFLTKGNFIILNDLRLKVNNHYFQIDSLLISSKLFIVIDSKNISGTVIFDYPFNQLIRVLNDKVEGMKDPLVQVRRHTRQLSQLLLDQKHTFPPIEHLIVVTNSSAIIRSQGSNQRENRRILHSELLVERIADIENHYSKEVISTKEVKKIGRALIKSHSPLTANILKPFDIHPSEIRTVVFCPVCSYLAMERIYGSWKCPSCGFKCKDAHIPALQDYFLLLGPTINLSQFSTFLQLTLSNRKSNSNILISLNLPHKGTKKGRVYDLSPLLKI